MHTGTIGPEDYMEPRCVLCGEPYGAEPSVKPVPQQRIIAKMDYYMSRRDYAGAERHLLYWLEEARLGGDLRGQLMVQGELVGHYRKTGDREKAMAHAADAERLLEEMHFGGTVSAGTTYVNIATACSAFGEQERALELFEKAREAYEGSRAAQPQLLGGLYNNMALACAALGRFPEARVLYGRALEMMERVPGGELEQAITWLNMADALREEKGMEQAEQEIFDMLDRAGDLLDTDRVPRDGYYAFVCEKCAPAFSYYGYFLMAEELTRRAEEIYARA